MQIGGFSGTFKTDSVGSSVEKALTRNDVLVVVLVKQEDSTAGEEKGQRAIAAARGRIRLGLMMRLATWRAERMSVWIVVVVAIFVFVLLVN